MIAAKPYIICNGIEKYRKIYSIFFRYSSKITKNTPKKFKEGFENFLSIYSGIYDDGFLLWVSVRRKRRQPAGKSCPGFYAK